MREGVAPLTEILLDEARDKEAAQAGGGLAWLKEQRGQVAASIANGGLQMISASEAGKAFAYATGFSLMALNTAIMEALKWWRSYALAADRTAALARILDTPPASVAQLRF